MREHAMRSIALILLSVAAQAGARLTSQNFIGPSNLMVGGSTVPAQATLEVRVSTGANPGAYVLAVSSSSGIMGLVVTQSGHVGSRGTAPVLSSCGTSPALSATANDNHGTITVGAGVSVLSCTMTFAVSRTNTPDCVVTDNSTAIAPDISAVSGASISFSFSASLSGGKIFYHCDGD